MTKIMNHMNKTACINYIPSENGTVLCLTTLHAIIISGYRMLPSQLE